VEAQRGIHPEYLFVFTPKPRRAKKGQASNQPEEPQPRPLG